MVDSMKKVFSILYLLTTALLVQGAPVQLPDNEMQTASGVTVLYRAGTLQKPGSIEFLRELDREITRLFRAPPGIGSCRILVDREHSKPLAVRSRKNIREILLPENFTDFSEDPAFRAELAGEILGGRFGLRGRLQPLPGWIGCGLEGIRQNARSAGRIVRNQQYYPVLRGLLGIDCIPDFRALMQLEDCRFSGTAGAAVNEFGRFLLETFAGLSSLKRNALGDYTAEMLKGIRKEPDIYRSTLYPAMTTGRYAGMTDAEFLRQQAGLAAFNYRTPQSAQNLLARLPGLLDFEVRSPKDTAKILLKGKAADLPGLMEEKKTEALLAQMQLRQKIQRFSSEFPPEILPAAGSLLAALNSITGKDPEKERAALQSGLQKLEQTLKNWQKVEKYLEDCEKQFIRPGLLFRGELSIISGENEFLTGDAQKFFDQVEKKYLAH